MEVKRMTGLIMLLVTQSIMGARVPRHSCDENTLEQQYLQFVNNSIYEFLFQGETSSVTSLNFGEQFEQFMNPSSATCGDLSNTDTLFCPHHHVLTVNENRYPVELREAKCSCTNGCRGSADRSKGTCVPVILNTPVLYRTKSNSCHYERRWYPLPIACRCQTLVTVHSQ